MAKEPAAGAATPPKTKKRAEQKQGSPSTRKLVTEWQKADESIKELESELREARREKSDAAEALINHLLPENAETGEKFQIWVRDKKNEERVIVVTNGTSSTDARVEWRQDRVAEHPVETVPGESI